MVFVSGFAREPGEAESMADKTTAATLESQLVADDGLEELPEFEEPEKVYGDMSELQRSRDKVRPSERCGTPSPFGIGCTLKAFHGARHSWDKPATETNAATVNAVDFVQPHLPGTPDHERDDYAIPYESAFNGADFQAAPGVKAIADRHIADTEEFAHLRGTELRYFWKRRGGLKGGNPRLGALVRPTGLAAYALGNPAFCLWLGADHCRDAKLTHEQIDALIFDCLAHSAVDPDDHSAYRVLGNDFEGMALTVSRYGLWNLDLREAAVSLRQLPLEAELDLPALDGPSDEMDN